MKKSMGLLNPLGVIGFFYVINQSLWKTYRRGKNSSSIAALKKTTASFHDGHGDLTMDMEVQWQPHHGPMAMAKNMIGWLAAIFYGAMQKNVVKITWCVVGENRQAYYGYYGISEMHYHKAVV